MSRYPTYPSQPFTGSLPGVVAAGPPDLLASSSTGPYYQARIDRMYGRHLAGFGEVQDEAAEPEFALNELRLASQMDDTVGNGVFDSPGTKPNRYPDAGIFAGRWGLPGYIDREVSYQVSEVIDATTGRNVVYVPSGAVPLDSAAQIAYLEKGLYAPPTPPMLARETHPLRSSPTWDTMQVPQAVTKRREKAAKTTGVSGLPLGLSYNTAAVVLGLVGLAGTVAYFTMRKK